MAKWYRQDDQQTNGHQCPAHAAWGKFEPWGAKTLAGPSQQHHHLTDLDQRQRIRQEKYHPQQSAIHQPVANDRKFVHKDFSKADTTTSTCSLVIWGNIGRLITSPATFSATGKSPFLCPNSAYASCKCSPMG